jgi:hypothetical protein
VVRRLAVGFCFDDVDVSPTDFGWKVDNPKMIGARPIKLLGRIVTNNSRNDGLK